MLKVFKTSRLSIVLLLPVILVGGEITFLEHSNNTSSVYAECSLALLGGISHDAEEIDQFGYDVEDGYENYNYNLQIGAGHYFNHLGIFGYTNFTQFFPGFFFYQRNPYSPALLRFNTNMFGYGVELRALRALRFKAGYGNYYGNVEIGDDLSDRNENWYTDIDKASGFHWSVGLLGEIHKNLMVSWEFTHHGYNISPRETQTSASVKDINLSQWNLSLSLAYSFLSFKWD